MREVLPALPGESTSVALHPVLGSPLADRQGTAGETPQRVQRYGGDPEHVLMGANWSSHPKKKACSGNMGHTCLIFMGQTAVPLYAFLPGLT